MRTLLVGLLIAVAVLVLAVQLALPPYLEGRVEDRLEAEGGTARVSITAAPALTLIIRRGRSFRATGTALRFHLDERAENPFRHLDGFARVDLTLTDLEVGPLRLERLELSRSNRHEPYELALAGTTSPRELAGELGAAAGGAVGGLLGSLATGVLPGAGGVQIPVELEARVNSRDGRPEVAGARGAVAGLPAGPLAEIVLGVVLEGL